MPALQKRARFIVLTAIALMVLLIVPAFNDSTNIPKYSVLFFAAALGASVLSIPKFGLLEKKNWKTWAPPVLFLSIMLIIALITDQKYTAFFGNYGRNNGWFQYLGLTTLFLLTAFSFNFNSLVKFLYLVIALGFIIAFYGYAQYVGQDFLDYADTSLPVIATLGNSNFASTFMGLSAIAVVWKITESKPLLLKLASSLILLGQVYVIYLSKSSQGLLILLLGSLIYLGIRYFTSNKKMMLSYFSIFGSISFLGLLGLLQIGPLTRFVYQESTTYRGDYYRAAWGMFKSHPFTGVGIDRFGEYYRTYRDIDAALRLGPSSVANYAHNAFLQLLATGGIFLFLAYLVMIIFVSLAAIKGLGKFKDRDKSLFAVLVALWIAFQIQAQVSIDQIAIAATGWVLAGAIVALGFNDGFIRAKDFQPNIVVRNRKNQMNVSGGVSVGLTFVLVISCFAWLVPIWRADSDIKKAKIIELTQLEQKKNLALAAVEYAPGEIRYKIMAAQELVVANNLELARQQLKDALNMDPQSYEAISYAAQIYRRAGFVEESIKIRIIASKMDPNDVDNWIELGRAFARIGDYEALNKVIELVQPLTDKSSIEEDLRKLLPKEKIG